MLYLLLRSNWSFAEKTCGAKHGAQVRNFVSKNSVLPENGILFSRGGGAELCFGVKRNALGWKIECDHVKRKTRLPSSCVVSCLNRSKQY